MPGRKLDPFSSPDAFDALHIHRLSVTPEHRGDPTVVVAPILQWQGDNGSRQCDLIFDRRCEFVLCRAVLA